MILIKLIKNFDFELDSKQRLEAIQFTVIRPIDGTRCFISTRKF
jgi:3'-phosphoadenosine 5'-phosphosulfate (PAPS) 3'-phosphatase